MRFTQMTRFGHGLLYGIGNVGFNDRRQRRDLGTAKQGNVIAQQEHAQSFPQQTMHRFVHTQWSYQGRNPVTNSAKVLIVKACLE
jgi:hypothetical protein